MTGARKSAFTLIELLLVIAIIGTLAGIVVAAVNPNEQLIAAADAERRTTAKEFKNAVYQYVIDGGTLPDNLPDSSLAAIPICPYNEVNDSSCINLDVLVEQDYLTSLPQDIAGQNIGTSGYEIYEQDDQVVVQPRLLGYKRSAITPILTTAGVINISANQTERIAVRGEYVYVCSSLSGGTVRAIDFSDPDNPVIVDTVTNGVELSLLASCSQILSYGDYLYVLDIVSDSLTVIDISDPAAMTEAGVIANGGGATQLSDPYDLAIAGSYAYVVSNTSDSLSVIDIANPAAMSEVETVVNGGGATELNGPWRISLNGDYAYVISVIDDSLSIFNISDPANIVETGTIIDGVGATAIDSPVSLTVAGNYAYVTSTSENALSVIDVSDAANPAQVTTIAASSSNHVYATVDTEVVGKYLYTHSSVTAGGFAEIYKGIVIFSLADPENPVQFVSNNVSLREPNNFVVTDNKVAAINTWTGNLYFYELW